MQFARFFALALTAVLAGGALPSSAQDASSTEFEVAGLESSAEILVDRWGVPHMYAGSFDDVFFVQGFNAARDRLWQIDLWRRRGLGRLAEVLGPAFVEKDRAARLFLYRGDMYSEWLAYGSDAKRIATAFTSGINAYVELISRRPDLLPWEFEFLGYQPAKWDPADVVRIRSHGLVRNVSREVSRARLAARHGLEAAAIQRPLEPAWTTTVPDGLRLEDIPGGVLDVYRLATRGVRFSKEVLAGLPIASAGNEPAPADPESIGSNNWVVSGRLTASGRPILANDPHRSQSLPSLRYMAHLVAPGLNVIGAGEPALPGISIGHNERIAFGLTIFAIDQEDLYVYETNPGSDDEYRYRDRWEPMEIVRETIPVRGTAAQNVELRFTRHGPVVFRDPARRQAFAVRAAWLEPGMAPYFGSIEYMRAHNWDEFLAAMDRWGAPSENQVYADVDGNIGWKPGGRAPIRPNWDGLLPVPGDGRYEWAGYWDMDQLPVEHNPPRGFIATANEMNLPDDYPYRERKPGFEWSAPFRKQRIDQVLSQASGVTVASMLQLQSDHVSVPAQRLRPHWRRLRPTDQRLQTALQLLADWDLRLENDSAAAALFVQWLPRLGVALLRQAVAGSVAEAIGAPDQRVLLDMLDRPAEWFGHEAGRKVREALAESLAEAVSLLEDDQGPDPALWRFGRYNRMGLAHALSPVVDAKTRERIDIAAEEKCPTAATVGRTNASWRQILDVGNWDASIAMSNPGQSADPSSPWYRNLWDPWKRCKSFPLLYSRERIEAQTRLRIRLKPHGTP